MKPAVLVEGLSKSYYLSGPRASVSDLRETIAAYFKKSQAPAKKADDAFWALSDVSFEVKQGEVMGVVGRNGAGKSTLFKMLSRITVPTRGRAEIRGRLGSLLEVGTGFHPDLTGRENIYMSGAVLGMRIREIQACFDRIVDFSGISRFIDTPVKYYSSGMYVRLAFSVAAHLRTDVLLLDEVLAVGDYEFQRKCLNRMQEIRNEGRTIVFVSHSMSSIANVCERAVLLEGGRVSKVGPVNEVVQEYLHGSVSAAAEVRFADRGAEPGTDAFKVNAVRVRQKGQSGRGRAELNLIAPIEIEMDYRVTKPNTSLLCCVRLKDINGATVLTSTNHESLTIGLDRLASRPLAEGQYRTLVEIPANFLNDGLYSVSLVFLQPFFKVELSLEDAVTFFVHDTSDIRKHFLGPWHGTVRPKLNCETEELGAGNWTAQAGATLTKKTAS